jgi:hypothetical protein
MWAQKILNAARIGTARIIPGTMIPSSNSVTRQAIANYQYDAGLIVKGIVDALTVASLGLE